MFIIGELKGEGGLEEEGEEVKGGKWGIIGRELRINSVTLQPPLLVKPKFGIPPPTFPSKLFFIVRYPHIPANLLRRFTRISYPPDNY